MKFFLIALFFLIGCSSVQQLQTDCDMQMEELFDDLTAVLLEKGFEIKTINLKLGYLQAETPESYEAFQGNQKKVWIFKYNNNGIVTASAKIIGSSSNAYGGNKTSYTTHYGESSHSSHKWYWDVRNNLEKLCGGKIVVKPLN